MNFMYIEKTKTNKADEENISLGYSKDNGAVFGKPDLTFKKLKIAIFVDS